MRNYVFQDHAMDQVVNRRTFTAGIKLDPRLVYMKFVVDHLAPGHVILRVLPPQPVTIPLMLHLNLYFNSLLLQRQNGRSLGTFRQNQVLELRGAMDTKINSYNKSSLLTYLLHGAGSFLRS